MKKEHAPSTNGLNGRKADGTFSKGNPGGPGNPRIRDVARFRSLFLDAVTDADITATVQAIVGKARKGDLAAANILFDRLLGKAPLTIANADGSNLELDGRQQALDLFMSSPEAAEHMLALADIQSKLMYPAESESMHTEKPVEATPEIAAPAPAAPPVSKPKKESKRGRPKKTRARHAPAQKEPVAEKPSVKPVAQPFPPLMAAFLPKTL